MVLFRRRSILLLLPGILLLAIAVASEFRALVWWSPVDFTGPHQRFASLARGEFRIGTRGTAGFFTRAIPLPGFRVCHPRSIPTDAFERFYIPRTFTRRQTRGLTIPLAPVGLLAFGLGLTPLPHRGKPGHCPRCGYDLRGLEGRPCPECGASRT